MLGRRHCPDGIFCPDASPGPDDVRPGLTVIEEVVMT
jgi:hypothetical protein